MKTTLLLALLTACSPSSSIEEIECTDLNDLNRGGSVHVVGPAEQGGIIESVWCGEDSEAGLECHEQTWWIEGGDIYTNCPTVGEDEDRGVLWVRVER